MKVSLYAGMTTAVHWQMPCESGPLLGGATPPIRSKLSIPRTTLYRGANLQPSSVTALPALNVVRPALLRPWREAVWRDQDFEPGCSLSSAFLFFDEAQYCAWSRDLAFGYFSKPAAVGYPAPTILVTAELLRQAKSVLTDNRDVPGGCSIAFATHRCP
jgi:hypothetical protein